MLLEGGGICPLSVGDSTHSPLAVLLPSGISHPYNSCSLQAIVFPTDAGLRASLCLLQSLSEFFSTLFSDFEFLEVWVGVPCHMKSKYDV